MEELNQEQQYRYDQLVLTIDKLLTSTKDKMTIIGMVDGLVESMIKNQNKTKKKE